MFDFIMRAINGAVIGMKDAIFGDLGIAMLFLLCITITFTLRHAYANWTKTYDAEALKKKWIFVGYLVLATYRVSNWVLAVGYIASAFFLYASGVTSGMSMHGQLADIGSPLTSIKTGQYQIYANNGVIGNKNILLAIGLTYDDQGKMIQDTTNLVAFKAHEDYIAQNTEIAENAYVDISLTNGTSWLSGLSESQAQRLVDREYNRWYNKVGRFGSRLASIF